MAWIAKNNPDWEQFEPPTEDPDPQWEMAKRGDKYALMLEMEYLASLVDTISHKAEVLQRTIHDLRDGLERHSAPDPDEPPVAEDFRSGSLRVSASVRGQRDRPPTTQQ
jgi:hypothetical protein